MREMILPDGWSYHELGQVLPYEQPTQYIVESTNYKDTYTTPVLTAGKTFIIGYTNEGFGIYDALPVIIFDDFTTAAQYVNFKFKVKSSAMKILTADKKQALTKFLYYMMQTIQCKHDTHKRYWIQTYSKIKVPIPSIFEQERIVAKIEELSSEVDKGVEMLRKAKAQLKVYRQAVLKDAFEGRYLDKCRSNLKKQPLETIVDCIRIGPFGTMLHVSDYICGGIPIINPKHIKNQRINPDVKVTVSDQKAEELQSYKLKENDIVLGRRGEMGRSFPVDASNVGWICGTGSMILRLRKENVAKFYSLILSSQDVVHYLEENCTGTTMKNLNEKIVKNIPVPIFTRCEQEYLLNEIESRLSVCDKIEQIVDEALLKAESLRQSILKKAFKGELLSYMEAKNV